MNHEPPRQPSGPDISEGTPGINKANLEVRESPTVLNIVDANQSAGAGFDWPPGAGLPANRGWALQRAAVPSSCPMFKIGFFDSQSLLVSTRLGTMFSGE